MGEAKTLRTVPTVMFGFVVGGVLMTSVGPLASATWGRSLTGGTCALRRRRSASPSSSKRTST